jgi:RNA polymerase sigma factor FliA
MRIIKRRTGDDRSKQNGTSGNGKDHALLERYRRSHSVKIRNELVERYRSIVEEMARTLRLRLPRSVDVQDLTHAGMWGLIQAIENYRAELGPSFTPFMRIRVRGAMIDELRNMDYLPRLYRSRMRMRDEATTRLRTLLDREPSDAELADDLGVSEVRLRQMFTMRPPVAHFSNRTSDPEREDIQEMDLMGSLADHDQEAPIEAIDRRELIEKIESSLQPVEWDVLRMHYLEGMSGKEVARKLHLSASRICQIHGRVLSRLKSRLSGLG